MVARRPEGGASTSRSSTSTAPSPTASATTRSSPSGRASPRRWPTRCSRRWRSRTRKASEFNPIYIMADSGARGSQAADPPARRDARPHGAPLGRDHREPDHLELPRRPHRAAVLHLHPRRPQGPGRHRAQDRGLGLPDPAPGGREPGRDHLRARLRHRGRHRHPAHHRVGRGHRAPARPHRRPRQPREHQGPSRARSSSRPTRRSPRRRPTTSRPRASRRCASAPCSPASRSAACAPSATGATSPPASWSRWAWRWASSPPSRSASPGTQLTMRTFHIGGTASHTTEQTTLEAKNAGTVKFHNLTTVKNKKGDLVVMNRSGALIIQDQKGRERERHAVVYGAKLKVKEGAGDQAGPAPRGVGPLLVHHPHRGRGPDQLQGRHRRPDRPRAGGREHRHGRPRHHGVARREEAAAHRDQGREGQDASASTCCPRAPT